MRALYTALNYAVTSVEAICCKRWLCGVHDELCRRFRYGDDAVIVLWIHDEIVVAARPEIAAEVGEILVRHAKEPGEFYGLKVALDADFKICRNWAGAPIEDVAADMPQRITQLEIDEINAGLIREGIKPLTFGIASTPPEPTVESAAPLETAPVAADEPADNAGNGADRDVEPVAAASSESQAKVTVEALASERPSRGDEVPPWIDDPPPRPRQSGNDRDGFDDFAQPRMRSGKILCPFHDDHTPSLEIYPDPDDLHFHCWVCHKHGRLDELNELGIDWQAALKSPTGKAPDALGEDDSRNLERAHELWDKAKPIAGTLGERYLAQTRGVDVSALPANIDEALRFHPRCPFGQGKRHPCLIALFRDLESGERAGIHRIALTPDAQKIDRRMFGRWPRSRAIKLWPADDRLFVGEGIETVLAAATRLQMQPAWAMASTIYLAKLPVISGIAELNILVDRDVHGEAAAAACHRTWKDAGRRVRRLRTKNARLNDFNDLILAKLRLRIVS